MDVNPPVNPPEPALKERIALVKRFKELLIEQRKRFHGYIEILDRQKNAIENGDIEEIEEYVELDENITDGIIALQKSIEPMRGMFEIAVKVEDPEIPEISAALENLKNEAAARMEANKDLLQKRMAEIGAELKTLRNNPLSKRKSIYAGTQSAALVDISG
jgi:hypothetical protein